MEAAQSAMAFTTLGQVLEALRGSECAITASQVLERMPADSRMPQAELEAALREAAANGTVFVWPRDPSRALRFWIRSAAQHSEIRLLELLTDRPLPLREIEKALAGDLAGYSASQRRAQIRTAIASLMRSGSLYEYPKTGKAGAMFSRKPADPGPFLKSLRKAFDSLAAKLQPAGVTRERIAAGLLTAAPLAPKLDERIVEQLTGRRGGLSLQELRVALASPPPKKEDFDRAILALYRANRVYLDRHDRPSVLSDSEREELVGDGDGGYYTGVTLRGEVDKSLS